MLGMQANSGCIRQCPFQQFHDNMHGHNRIAQSKVGEKFDFSVFLCRTNYARGNYEDFLRSTWIRPEDLPEYERFVDVVKLATRRHPHPVEVLNAYATYSYDGSLADLMDACHTFPKSFDNKSFDAAPELWREGPRERLRPLRQMRRADGEGVPLTWQLRQMRLRSE